MWEKRRICPNCGYNVSDRKHNFIDICPCCGKCKGYWNNGFNTDFISKTMRWISLEKWWNPVTWGKGYWEELKD